MSKVFVNEHKTLYHALQIECSVSFYEQEDSCHDCVQQKALDAMRPLQSHRDK